MKSYIDTLWDQSDAVGVAAEEYEKTIQQIIKTKLMKQWGVQIDDPIMMIRHFGTDKQDITYGYLVDLDVVRWDGVVRVHINYNTCGVDGKRGKLIRWQGDVHRVRYHHRKLRDRPKDMIAYIMEDCANNVGVCWLNGMYSALENLDRCVRNVSDTIFENINLEMNNEQCGINR